jgi:hypothetical protein
MKHQRLRAVLALVTTPTGSVLPKVFYPMWEMLNLRQVDRD